MDERAINDLYYKVLDKHVDKKITMEKTLLDNFPKEAMLLTEAQYNKITHKKYYSLNYGCTTIKQLPLFLDTISKEIWEQEGKVGTGEIELEQFLADFLSIEYAGLWILQQIDERYCEIMVDEDEAFEASVKFVEENTTYLKHDTTFDIEEVREACYVEEDICEKEEDNF